MSKKNLKQTDLLCDNKFLDKISEELAKVSWKRIYVSGVETMYSISNYGQIMSHYIHRELKPYKLPNGYMDIQLHIDKKIHHKLVHRLVAVAFVDNPDPVNKNKVNHKDGDKTNNKYWNLEWVTNQENMDHAIETGLINNTGSRNPNNVYSEDQIHQVCSMLEDGMGPTEISKLINVDRDTVGKIKSREVWKHISVDYEIPWPAKRVYSIRPSDVRDKIINMLSDGVTDYGKILLKVGLPDIRRNRKYITNINIRLRSK